MADAVLLVDARGQDVEVNRAAAELLGLPSRNESSARSRRWAERFQLRFLDGSPVPFRPLRERARAWRASACWPTRRSAARRRARRLRLGRRPRPSAAPTDRPELAVAVLRDVSAARRLDELRDEFLATAAHEFKTPLAVVKAYAQLLQKREPAEAQALARHPAAGRPPEPPRRSTSSTRPGSGSGGRRAAA